MINLFVERWESLQIGVYLLYKWKYIQCTTLASQFMVGFVWLQRKKSNRELSIIRNTKFAYLFNNRASPSFLKKKKTTKSFKRFTSRFYLLDFIIFFKENILNSKLRESDDDDVLLGNKHNSNQIRKLSEVTIVIHFHHSIHKTMS